MNSYDLFSEALYRKADALGIPLSGTFELTARCNLDCKMCYIHRRANDASVKNRERTAAQWIELAEQCQKAGMLHLLLTGGEPFLRPDFREIYEACRNLGLMVSLNSNASLITDDTVAWLAENRPTRMNLTLYGASPETYGALCSNPDAFQRAKHAVLALQDAGILVKLNYSITPYNRDDAEAVYAFAKEHGIALQAVSYMFPPVRACENGPCSFTRATPEESARDQIVYDRFRMTPERLTDYWKKILKAADTENLQKPARQNIACRAGSSNFWVTWDGQMRPCGMMTEPTFDLNRMEFPQAWQAVRESRKQIFQPEECTACSVREVCSQCAAVCQAETGSFEQLPQYACDRTKAYLELIRENLREMKGTGT